MMLPLRCILEKCAHNSGPCYALGECGAAYALRHAEDPQGYRVFSFDNPTIAALKRAGLVRSKPESNRVSRVFAVKP